MKLREVENIPVSSEIVHEFAASRMKYAELVLDEGVDFRTASRTLRAYVSKHKELGVKVNSRNGKIYLRKEVRA